MNTEHHIYSSEHLINQSGMMNGCRRSYKLERNDEELRKISSRDEMQYYHRDMKEEIGIIIKLGACS
jgi:hypothetical protein